MEVYFGLNGWLIAGAICLAIFLIVAWIMRPEYWLGDNAKQRQADKHLYGFIVLGAAVICYIVANLVVALLSSSTPPTYSDAATSSEMGAHFGLESGKEYPLVLGETFSGTSGEVRGGLFHTNGTFRPATGLAVGFTVGQNSYRLDLPSSGITFRQDPNAIPSLTLHLSQKDRGSFNYTSRLTSPQYGPCQWQLNNLWVICSKRNVVQPPELRVSPEDERLGLGTVVSKGFTGATIVLTPEMYNAIMQGTG